VDSAGSVTLTWSPVTDSLGRSFKFYKVWVSHYHDSGYVVIDSVININTASFFHQQAGANNDTLFYIVETVSGCHNMFSAFSDTLSTIFLNLDNQGNGVAHLSWNDIRDSSSAGMAYKVWRSVAGGLFTPIDSTTITTFNDTLNVCTVMVTYRITLDDTSGCSNVSNIRTDVFTDKIAPLATVMDTVSVTANNRPVVGWLPSASPDVATYIILRNGTAIDTVTSSPFIDIAADASLTSYCYAVAAIDSCGNISDTTATHCTMLGHISI